MSQPRDVFQQVFGLSLASNAIQNCAGTSESLQKRLSEELKRLVPLVGPGWEVVWGPAVWKKNPRDTKNFAGNSWFVAKNESVTFEDKQAYCTYVVSIAGTNGMWDWIREDLGVFYAVDLDAWLGPGGSGIKKAPKGVRNSSAVAKSSHAFSSNGFAQAVFNLMNTHPTKDQLATLPEFLNGIPAPESGHPLRLVFAGHSLGGALAPVLAYALDKANALGRFKREDVRVYPTAGPTPGNEAFSTSFQAAFPPPPGNDLSGYQHWNCNIVNRHDVVPQGYCTTPNASNLRLSNIPFIYGGDPHQYFHLITVKMAVAALERVVGETYRPLPTSEFNGPDAPSKVPADRGEFQHDACIQHVESYTKYILGIQRPKSACEKENEVEATCFPVLGILSRTTLVLDDRLEQVLEWDPEVENRRGTEGGALPNGGSS